MKAIIVPVKFYLLVCLGLSINSNAQVAGCVHGHGIQYILDAYLGSIGACNCEKSPVFFYSFPSCNTDPYELEFEDNFDGNSLDTSKWEIQPWGQGPLRGAANIEYSTLDNVSLANGICYLTAKKETVERRAVNWKNDDEILADGLPNLRTYDYTSSNLWTKDKFFQGKYEIKCRMPKGNGFWPAFWMFGGKRWNEIDVFDNYAGTNKFVCSIGHDFDGTNKSNGCNGSYSGYDFSEWHTFTCIFDFDKIAFLIDDKLIRIVHRIVTVDGYPIQCGDEIAVGTYYQLKSFPIERMSIIMNLALVAKNSTGSFIPVDDSTPFPSSLEVDYVKMWKRSPIIETVSIYPNPSANFVTVTSNTDITFINVYNVNGEIIYTSKGLGSTEQINLSTFPEGIYFIKVGLSNSSRRFKVIKLAQ